MSQRKALGTPLTGTEVKVIRLIAQGHRNTTIAQTLGISVARVYLTKHRVSALLKKEVMRLERQVMHSGH